jgi:predicted ArsR family transcriptional regulator
VVLKSRWTAAAGNPRKDSITARLIDALPVLSFTDADQVAEHLTVDPNVARRGLNALEVAGVLSKVASSKRNRVWRADDFHQLLDSYGADMTRDAF